VEKPRPTTAPVPRGKGKKTERLKAKKKHKKGGSSLANRHIRSLKVLGPPREGGKRRGIYRDLRGKGERMIKELEVGGEKRETLLGGRKKKTPRPESKPSWLGEHLAKEAG